MTTFLVLGEDFYNFMSGIFGTYDIRGLDGLEINTGFANKLGFAFGDYLLKQNARRVIVGHDSRVNSQAYGLNLADGLIESGLDVTFIGLTSTPMLNYLSANLDFCAGAMVTASHLSAKYNGFKLCGKNANAIGCDSGLKEIERIYYQEPIRIGNKPGKLDHVSYIKNYLEFMQNYLANASNLAIGVDSGHGSIYPEIVGLLDGKCRFIGINNEPNGDFSLRPSNPLDKGALDELSKMIVDLRLDFGAGFDGDGDRIIIIDELGRMVDPDILTAIIAVRLLNTSSHEGGKVFYDLRSSKVVPELINNAGGLAQKCKVGHSFIKNTMQSESGLFAGEMSGHYYYQDLYNTDNALRTLVEVINIVSDLKSGNSTLGKLVDEYKKYSTSQEINFAVNDVHNIIARLESQYNDGLIEKLDGLTINYPNWWFNARPSQTEPMLRLRLEAYDSHSLKLKLSELENIITNS